MRKAVLDRTYKRYLQPSYIQNNFYRINIFTVYYLASKLSINVFFVYLFVTEACLPPKQNNYSYYFTLHKKAWLSLNACFDM